MTAITPGASRTNSQKASSEGLPGESPTGSAQPAAGERRAPPAPRGSDQASAGASVPGAGTHEPPREPAGGPAAADRGGGWRLGPWRASWSPREHAAAVEAVRDAIGRGDVYQVNVVGHASAPYTGDPGPALLRVAGLPGARYGGVLAGDGWALATASPETLVEVRDGRVVTRPIKGTRPATEAGRRELLASAKERAEHVMIVDLERNDLSRLPGLGPVRVEELFAVRRWVDLWQAESVVSAPVTGRLDLADLLRAVCPGGSVTGAPKLAALNEIGHLEPVGRGVSMGAIGWVAADYIDLGLSIRTVAVDGSRVHAWAGGGITWDSDADAEVAEAAAKAAPIRAALAGDSGGGATA
nr:chorismate-binding protein [Actinoplanes rishiriensis]